MLFVVAKFGKCEVCDLFENTVGNLNFWTGYVRYWWSESKWTATGVATWKGEEGGGHKTVCVCVYISIYICVCVCVCVCCGSKERINIYFKIGWSTKRFVFFLIYLFCSYIHIYVSNLLLLSENIYGTRPC